MTKRVVDLTLSSEDEEPVAKRRRGLAPLAPKAGHHSDDSDVMVVEGNGNHGEVSGPRSRAGRASLTARSDDDLGDEDLVITKATGQVATRDMAHPRQLCAEHPFSAGVTTPSNAVFCPQCYCYVCDVKASECRFWGTGARERDHANARTIGYWKRLREAARAGNRGLVQSEYRGTGPLGSGMPAQAQQQTRLPFPATGARNTSVAATPAPAAGPSGTRAAAAANPAAAAPNGHRFSLGPGAAGPSNAANAAAVAPTPTSGQQAHRPLGGSNAAAAAGRASGPSAAAAAPAAAPTAAATPATAPAAPQAAAADKSPTVTLPSGACSLRRLPDPTSERNAFELGVLRLSVKAARGLTLAAVAERLERFGFYYKLGTNKADYGNRFALDNLLESKSVLRHGNYKPKSLYLKLNPLPPTPEETVPVPTERVRKVLVVDCLGRSRATYLGVRVQHKVKRADLLATLAPRLRPPFSADNEVLHLVAANSMEGSSFSPVDPERYLDDAFCGSYHCSEPEGPHLIVFRTAHHPSPSWEETADSAGAGAAGNDSGSHRWAQRPVYYHSLPTGCPSSGLNIYVANAVPSWILVHVRHLLPPPGPGGERLGFSTKRLSVPVLVPLRKDYAKGGRDAEKEVTGAVMRALQSYRSSTATPAAAGPSVLLRGNRANLTDQLSAVGGDMKFGVTGDQLSSWSGNTALLSLTAVWPQDLSAASLDAEGLRAPVVDPSAAPEAISESKAHAAEAKRRDAMLMRRKSLPAKCIQELVYRSRRPYPEDKATISGMTQMGGKSACEVAVDAVLVPSSRRGNEREGELVIKVYTWSSSAAFRDTLFKAWDDWPSIGKRDHVSFALPATMELLATGAADPDEHRRMAAAAAGAGAGPSTSAAAAAAALGGGSSALQRRQQAERQRAREMVTQLKALQEDRTVERAPSINTLLAFMQSGELPTAPQPPGLTVSMRPYQLQSLNFMVNLEKLVDVPGEAGGGSDAAGPSTSAAAAAGQADPADPDAPDGGCPGGYRRLFWLPLTNSRGKRYWYSPVFERLSLEVPRQPVGGFLGEEMGLGKTVEVMALTLANPPPPCVVAGSLAPCGRIVSRGTLVVCAVSLVGQWQAEAANKTSGSCLIHPYHGPNRIRDPERLAEFDVVVTTYQTLQSDRGGPRDPCQAIKWHRIVFDEGHTLRSAGAKMYKAAVELAAERKWVCTGTPINNAVEDLLGQFGAIHLAPLGKKTYFDSYIKAPFAGTSRHGLSVLPLLFTLRHTMVRHTKAQNLGGQDVLQLPDKTETDVPVFLSAAEQALYRKVHKEAQRNWQKLKSVGPAYVNSHLFTATSMLMPLRRICSGGLLEPRDLAVPDPDKLAALGGGSGGGSGGGAADDGGPSEVPVPADVSECPICVDTMEQPVVTRCNHWFCRECLSGWINASAHHNCPACRQPVTLASLRRGIAVEAQRAASAAAEAGAAGDDAEEEAGGAVPCESKLRVLLQQLRTMREEDPTAKALVFTQFGQTLEWLKPRLLEEGFGHRTITGHMTQKRRTEAIESFQRDPATSVFLLSVRSGAVGINLTAANHVFLLEPCMNPAMEEQAIGRSWRMGQQRPVVVKRLYVKGSVEERIMEVVKTRRSASGGAAAAGQARAAPAAAAAAADAAAGPSNRGGAAPVAGSLRQDKTDLRINELELMFGDPDFPPVAQ